MTKPKSKPRFGVGQVVKVKGCWPRFMVVAKISKDGLAVCNEDGLQWYTHELRPLTKRERGPEPPKVRKKP